VLLSLQALLLVLFGPHVWLPEVQEKVAVPRKAKKIAQTPQRKPNTRCKKENKAKTEEPHP
jgi:hypothetical protein